MCGCAIIFYICQSLDFTIILNKIENTNIYVDLACFCLFIGAVAKSAQIGLHTWLADAMEGPTPVSALIHAATMVTAGIFLIIRCSPIFEFSPTTRICALVIGSITTVFGAISATFQADIKRIIAFSTSSQLGYLLAACGYSAYNYALFHLFTHAYFKALLFLSAGSVIHGFADEQDTRRMGSVAFLLPLTLVSLLVGSLSITGIPFFPAYFSKEGIIEVIALEFDDLAFMVDTLGIVTAFFTGFYSGKLLIVLTGISPQSPFILLVITHEAALFLATAQNLLLVPSIIIGYLSVDMFIHPESSFFAVSSLVYMDNKIQHIHNVLNSSILIIPLYISICGLVISYIYYTYLYIWLLPVTLTPAMRLVYTFLNSKWYFDQLYNYYIVRPILYVGDKVSFELLDRGIFEWLGPSGIQWLANILVLGLRKLHSGLLYRYISIFFVGFAYMLFMVIINMLQIDLDKYFDPFCGVVCIIGSIILLSTNHDKDNK
jgi:proton-translocating NADH-quinone oxidoreductase chain L